MSLPIYPDLPGLAFPVDKAPSFANLTQSAPNGLDVVVQQTRNPVWKWTLIYEFLRDDPTVAAELIGGYTEYQVMQGFLLALAASAGMFLFRDRKDNTVGPGVISGSPNLQAQLQLVTDGVGNWYSPIQRNMGGQFYEDITDLNGAISVYANGTLKALTTDYTIVGPGLAIPGNSFMGLVVKWNLPSGVGVWQASHAYALNAEILDPAGHIQKVTTAGTSGTPGAPAWNDSGSTTPDGTGSLVWTDQGYNPAPATPITAAFQFYFRARFEGDSLDFSQWDAFRWTIGGTDAGQSEYVILKSARPNGV